MNWSNRSNNSFFLWFLVFFNVGSFLVRNAKPLTVAAQGTWSSWGPWSSCGARNVGRETRFRNCIDSDGNFQRSSKCPGHVRRTRQCGTCQYPLLNRRDQKTTNEASLNNERYTITHSAGLRPIENAWCSKRSIKNQYVEIAFENFVRFTGIGTHGYDGKYHNGYITQYKVQFSYNGEKWFPYTSKGIDVVFNGTMNVNEQRRTNFENEFVARYVRVYPTRYESRLCVSVQLYGCEFNCGGLITNNVVNIKAPNAAAQIQEPNCLWRVESSEATKIQFLFPYFKLLCREGFLKILYGASPFIDGKTFELLCGESRKISPLEFMGRELWLHYRGYPATDIGFHLQGNVFVIKTLSSSSSGEIQVPETGTGFKHVFRYTWMVIGVANTSILLTIHNFESDNIRRVNGKCVGDSIIIHNGTDIKKSLVTRLCDDKFPRTLHVQTDYVRIKYRAGSTKPHWKLHFSYKMVPSVITTSGSPALQERENTLELSTRPGNVSYNDTNLVLDAVGRENNNKDGASNVPVIISSILAVVIVAVFLVALLHFLRKRKQFLRKHPYDCSNRPVSHFGEVDATPFINQNVLMWNDSGSRKSDKEKPKKSSLPHVTVSLRSDENSQRLSIIPTEMLSTPSSEKPEEHPAKSSLVVSDAFTEECLQLLNNNFTPASESDSTPQRESIIASDKGDELRNGEDSDVESLRSETEIMQSETESVRSEPESVRSDLGSVKGDADNSYHDYEEIFEDKDSSLAEEKSTLSLGMQDDLPLTTHEIEKYLSWGAL